MPVIKLTISTAKLPSVCSQNTQNTNKSAISIANLRPAESIHSKSGMEKSADDLEFSAEGLSGNAKTIKFALLEEPALQFLTIYVQLLLKSQINTVCSH